MNILEYKGYHATVEYNAEDNDLVGKVVDVKDLILFSADSPKTLIKEFHKTINEYLAICKEAGLNPDKEYKGSFNVRISPSTHRELALIANKNHTSINTCVDEAIKEYLLAQA